MCTCAPYAWQRHQVIWVCPAYLFEPDRGSLRPYGPTERLSIFYLDLLPPCGRRRAYQTLSIRYRLQDTTTTFHSRLESYFISHLPDLSSNRLFH